MMTKNNVFLLLVTIVLVIAGAFVFFKNSKSTLLANESEFAITDTSKITSIVFANNIGQHTLCKMNNEWLYDSIFSVDEPMFALLVKIVSEADIASAPIVAEGELGDSIIRHGIDLEVFATGGALKHYYIYTQRASHKIYFMMHGAAHAFIVKIPAFEGNFSAIFTAPDWQWRNKTLLQLQPAQISRIEVVHLKKPNQSFMLAFDESRKAVVKNLSTSIERPVNADMLDLYMMGFKNVKVDAYFSGTKAVDSLKLQQPLYEISITGTSFPTLKVQIFPIILPAKPHASGTPPTDVNRAFISINTNTAGIIKYVEIDPIVREYDFFCK